MHRRLNTVTRAAVRRHLLALCLLTVLPACASSQLGLSTDVKVGQLDKEARLRDVPVHGVLTRLLCRNQGKSSPLVGELLAVEADAIWLLQDGLVARVHRGCIQRATIERHASLAVHTASWTAFSTLATFSHGAWAALSAPVCLLVGAAATAGQASGNDVLVMAHQLDRLRPYARFPAGRPPRYRQASGGPPTEPLQYFRLERP